LLVIIDYDLRAPKQHMPTERELRYGAS